MANRYWVGGTGNWTPSDTTHWSATSGGAGGASVPTSADDVFFDQAGAYSVNTGGGSSLACASLLVSAGSPVIEAGSPGLNCYGSFTLNATTTWNGGPNVTFLGTGSHTITTAAKTLPGVTFSGTGTYSLQDNLTATSIVGLNSGTLDLNSKNVSCFGFLSTSGSTRSLIMGTATIFITGSFNFDASTATGLTLSAASGTIRFTNQFGGTVYLPASGGFTLGAVIFDGNGAVQCGGNTLTALTINYNAGSSQPTSVNFTHSGTLTIGTMSCNGLDAQRRVIIRSNTLTVTRNLAVTTWASPADFDVRNIAVTGVSPNVTRGGDGGGNSGFTFPAPKTVYWNHASNTGFYSTSWATTATGTPAVANQPLLQDIIGSVGGSGSYPATMNWDNAQIGNINWGSVSSTVSLSLAGAIIHGDLYLSSSVTIGAISFTLYKAGTGGTTTLGIASTIGSTLLCWSEYLALASNLVGNGNSTLQLINGLTTNNFNMTLGSVTFGGGTVFTTWSLGSSYITILASGSSFQPGTTNMTLDAGTSTIDFKPSTAGTQTLSMGGYTYNHVKFSPQVAGCTLIVAAGQGRINTLSDSALAACTIQFGATGTYNIGSCTINGSSGNVITVKSNVNGLASTLAKPSPWNIGLNSTIGTNCAGLSVANDPIGAMNYLAFQDILGVNSAAGGNLFFGSNF